MLIMLPPSEGKTAPASGRAVDPDRLSHPDLGEARQSVLQALMRTSAEADATTRLGVGPSLHEEVWANTRLRQAPAAPAAEVYTGVLYEAAGLKTLTGTPRRRANQAVRIVSALWGVLTPADRIPAYRLPMGAHLEDLGPLASWWAPHLQRALAGGRATDVVVDCRSSAYLAAWRPPPGRPWLTVRVVAERNGQRRVVSHHAKHTRGVFAHHLLTRPAPLPRTSAQVLAAARELVGSGLLEATVTEQSGSGADVLELVIAG